MTEYLTVVVVALFLSGAGWLLYSRDGRGRKVISGDGYLQTSAAPSDGACEKVLILTAAVGGGHEAAGRALWYELEEAGHSVMIGDGLRTMSRVLDWLLVRGYADQVRHAPGSLAAVFAVTSRRAGAAAVQAVVSLLFARRLLGVIREENPDLVISTYPLVAATLGRLRKSGKLRTPAVAIIPDYGSHALWVTPTVDLHLAVYRRSAALVNSAGGQAVVVRLPVTPGFRRTPTPKKAREILGLPREAFVALVVGGAWGIGGLGSIARRAAESGAYAVIVTGNNAELKARLEKELGSRENVRILGWREDMPVLMAASNCLIQNGGAVTCLEAMETGLPILFFEPISGHGELNTRVMEQAGAARWVRTPDGLGALLRSLARGYASLPVPDGERAAPKASVVLDALIGASPRPVVPGRWVVVRPRPVLAGVTAIVLCCWLAFSLRV